MISELFILLLIVYVALSPLIWDAMQINKRDKKGGIKWVVILKMIAIAVMLK